VPDAPAPKLEMTCEYVGCALTQGGEETFYSPLEMNHEMCLEGVAATLEEIQVKGKRAAFFIVAMYAGKCDGVDNTQPMDSL